MASQFIEIRGWLGKRQIHFFSKVILTDEHDKDRDEKIRKASEEFKAEYPLITKTTHNPF